jgi:phage-related protein (TIGR01555 family)
MADVMKQIQIGIAAACRMPVSKLFGLSATGYDSGESDLETYNAIVETEREKAEEALDMILPCLMMKVWGFVPNDWSVEWKPLRVLKATDEMAIKMQQYTIDSGLYQAGILNAQEYCQKLKEDGILMMETDVSKGIAEPEPPMGSMMDAAGDEGEAGGSESGSAKGKQEKAKEG